MGRTQAPEWGMGHESMSSMENFRGEAKPSKVLPESTILLSSLLSVCLASQSHCLNHVLLGAS